MFFGLVKGEVGAKGRRKAIRSVLVVEDEPLVAFDNEHVLEMAGYRVAATVDEYTHAVSVIEDENVDLVIADVTLHGERTGIDLARFASGRGVSVLFVTGACPVDAQEVALGCLAKPYAPRDLLAAVAVVDALLRGKTLPRFPEGLHLFGDVG
ncbi:MULTISPECIES: response regulator [Sphingobium]|uniref:Response regulator n=1 Tax=Sphingobium chungbukense TaxID=56193 RepID=A0A0M3ARN0_9SPHN|nr:MULTISPECIES: response regulator [Sphingobium]KKW92568.1 response regulator [Sphingobium chungbukense]PJG49428.1 response regulator [Sphingobium sp. LB126]